MLKLEGSPVQEITVQKCESSTSRGWRILIRILRMKSKIYIQVTLIVQSKIEPTIFMYKNLHSNLFK